MSDTGTPSSFDESEGGNTIAPLEGEQVIPSVAEVHKPGASKKAIASIAAISVVLVGSLGVAAYKGLGFGKTKQDESNATSGKNAPPLPSQARKFDLLPTAAASAVSGASAPAGVTIVPAIAAGDDEQRADPIGVRGTGPRAGAATAGTAKATVAPEDAPVMVAASGGASPAWHSGTAAGKPEGAEQPATAADPLEQTKRNLQAYQRQLQGTLDSMTRTAEQTTRPAAAPLGSMPQGGQPPGAPNGAQSSSGNPGLARISASMLGNRSLTLPAGTVFMCALKNKLETAVAGEIGCLVQRNVYSDDNRVLLVDRGSHLEGVYRVTAVKPGTVRIPVVWTRLRTPKGVTVPLDSSGIGPLGEAGVGGYVDNRWGERLGAAMLVSFIDDAMKIVVADRDDSANVNGNTVVLPSTTAQVSKLAEKVLDSTINIPPLIYNNQGALLGVKTMHDIDFSSVYQLEPEAR